VGEGVRESQDEVTWGGGEAEAAHGVGGEEQSLQPSREVSRELMTATGILPITDVVVELTRRRLMVAMPVAVPSASAPVRSSARRSSASRWNAARAAASAITGRSYLRPTPAYRFGSWSRVRWNEVAGGPVVGRSVGGVAIVNARFSLWGRLSRAVDQFRIRGNDRLRRPDGIPASWPRRPSGRGSCLRAGTAAWRRFWRSAPSMSEEAATARAVVAHTAETTAPVRVRCSGQAAGGEAP